MGRVLGGWTFASVFAAGTGVPIQILTTKGDYQAFGACDGVGCADYDSENAVPIGPQNLHASAHYCITACPGQTSGYPVNAFSNGALDAMNWRNPILGLDTRDYGYGADDWPQPLEPGLQHLEASPCRGECLARIPGASPLAF